MRKRSMIVYFATVPGLFFGIWSVANADPGHGRDQHRESQQRYYPGPNNSRVPYRTGYYRDGNRRQQYTYPSDWRKYNRPQSWYRGHPNWHTFDHPDWYRGGSKH